jgi:hypothetical protein
MEPEVHYRLHNSPALVPILSHINPVHNIPTYSSILILHSHLCLRFPSGLFPSGFRTTTFQIFLIFPTHAACPANLIFLSSIVLIICNELYKLWSSTLFSLLQPPATAFLLVLNILLSTLVVSILSVTMQFHCEHFTDIRKAQESIRFYLVTKMQDKVKIYWLLINPTEMWRSWK